MKKIIILFLLYPSIALSSNSVTKVLPLSAEIQNEKFFSYRIKEFKFKQPRLQVEVDRATGELKSIETKLIVTTDVPSSFSAGYKISTNVLVSECFDNKGNSTKADFAEHTLDGEVLSVGKEITLNDFFTNRDTLWVEKEFKIDFDNDVQVDVEDERCSGKVTLSIGLDF
ncbi:hypothetical protein GCM10007906_31580 [Vibrio hyugaensis]|uniref:Uncharacterized protein n=1 Tax=Vibrio hyugaensis TaxID=1534743 RepID=A0ABQ5Y6B5_9VIBR|nr:hypothetical protein [Vibrio hyugaensis]GLR05570.1 hypothetical protein GCM10007906_31580 [Vibrio hyugaensis]